MAYLIAWGILDPRFYIVYCWFVAFENHVGICATKAKTAEFPR